MVGPAEAIKIVTSFIDLAKQLARLGELTLPQYRAASQALYEICQRMLDANETNARWYNNFARFDFAQSDASSKWSELVRDYTPWRAGPGFTEMKFASGQIGLIYKQKIENQLGTQLLDRVTFRRRGRVIREAQVKLAEAKRIFDELGASDGQMTAFVSDIFRRIDEFIDEADSALETKNVAGAQAAKLKFRAQSKDIGTFVNQSGADLGDLVLEFSQAAGVPLTLGKQSD